MRRLLLIALLLVTVPIAAGEEKWWEAYNRGVKAVNARNYDVAAVALQKAIAQMPAESNSIRANRNDIITYVPHFWLGIARFNLGDVDGAMQEWKTSEEQGAIVKTDYYPRLRDWVARAQTEKERSARTAAGDSKKAADAALARALGAQVGALTAGGDRTDTYRAANRKLQEAVGVFNSAGSNIAAYQRAEATASDARELFARSAEEARRRKMARAATPVRAAPPPVVQQQAVSQQAAEPKVIGTEPVATATMTQPQQPVATTPAPARDTLSSATTTAVPTVATITPVPQRQTTAAPQPIPAAAPPAQKAQIVSHAARAQLESAYRAFAAGNLDQSEQMLTSLVGAGPSAEAFLLRGCTRFTRAMLSRSSAALLDSARQDFRSALQMNRDLRLDSRAFSPKLISFFEQVRSGGR